MKNFKIIYVAFLLIINSFYLSHVFAQTSKTLSENNKQNSAYALYKQEINYRFQGGEWEKNLTQLSDRALMQEYVRMIGLNNYIIAKNLEKKQKIEALLATYTALNLQMKK